MRTRPHRVVEQHQQMLRRTQHLLVSHGGGVVDPTECAVSLADLQYRARAGSHDGGNPLVFRLQPLRRAPADDRYRRRPSLRRSQVRIARQQRGMIIGMSAQLAIFLFQRGQRLLEIAGVINRDLQRQHARAQVSPTPPIPIVRGDPPQLKIGFIAHARQIKGCCRQHLLAGNFFQALPGRRLPACGKIRLTARPRRERRRIITRQARLPKSGAIGAGAIRRA